MPIGENEKIIVDWRQFKAGTDRREIYKWLEKAFHVDVYRDLMVSGEDPSGWDMAPANSLCSA